MKSKAAFSLIMATVIIGTTACNNSSTATTSANNMTESIEISSAGNTAIINTEEDNKTHTEEEKQNNNVHADEVDIETRIDTVGKSYDGYYEIDKITNVQQASDVIAMARMAKQYEDMEDIAEEYKKMMNDIKSIDLLKYFEESDLYEDDETYGSILITENNVLDYYDTKTSILKYKKSDTDKIIEDANKYLEVIREYGYYNAITPMSNSSMSAETIGAAVTNDAVGDANRLTGDNSFYSEPDWETSSFKKINENRFLSTETSPFSTFGMDVDRASYATFRRAIYNGDDTHDSAIRTEEMINYFDYNYDKPADGEKFGVNVEITDTPWNEDTKLLKIGVKAEEKSNPGGIDNNVVFLIDTSGSMYGRDRLTLVQASLLKLLNELNEKDKLSIVTYAGSDEILCEGVSCDNKKEITAKILGLSADGGTNGASGIISAYNIAEKNYIKDGNNRIILLTDGDFNIGQTSDDQLVDLMEKERERGVFLSVFGVGNGNYQDTKMKEIADNGNGTYYYLDSIMESDKAMIKEFNTLMYTVAKDAKMQIEFNPARIKGYRQIGYESRQLEAEDFADDSKDGAEIGAGQCITMLYEIVPIDSKMDIGEVESRYQNKEEKTNVNTDELLSVSIRYKEPDDTNSKVIQRIVKDSDIKKEMSDDMKFASSVAMTSMLIRDSEFRGSSTYEKVYETIKELPDIMTDDYKAQFAYIVKLLNSQVKG